jgi:beta-lactamase superfamily II metal-dependent hydrolase
MSAEFTFFFVEMGQGDCCMVKCPDGKVVVVDCGSTNMTQINERYKIEAQVQLRTWVSSQGNKIDALVLTHSDIDHHSRVVDFFGETKYMVSVTLPSSGEVLEDPEIAHCDIDRIFFSNSAGDGSPLGKYTAGGLNNKVYNGFFKTNEIHEVTINDADDNKNYYKTWKYKINNVIDNFKTLASTTKIPNKRLTLFSGSTDGKAWSVSVIAGNVPRGYGGATDAATEENAKSLITLFEVDGKKALLTGDATFSTENFLYTIHKILLTNLDLAQVPHHGSSYASSKLLVQTVNPKAAVASVGFLEHSYRLPWYEDVLERWLDAVESHKANNQYHDLDYWYGKHEGTKQAITNAEIRAKYDEWTNFGKDLSRVGKGCEWPKPFCYLQAPANIVYAYYRLVNGGYFLYRETVNSNLCLTSQQTQPYTLSDAGVTYKG